jgi:hypothetical protein
MNVYYSSTNNSWSQMPPVGGNYWSDYKGADANSDGFGDSPYHVIENYSDYYPIVQATDTVQPASEDLSPSDTAPTSTGTVNPTGNPPAATDNSFSNEKPDTAAPANLSLWVAIAIVAVVGVLSILAGYWRNKKRFNPAQTS